jgi:TonB family protein
MLAVPALALLLAQPGSPCTDDPGRPAAVHLCRADQHLAAYQPDARGNPDNDQHLLDAVTDLMQATTAARGTPDFGVAALRLVRLFAPDRLNDPDKAVPVLQHLIEAEPANLEARFTLAAVLEAEGELGQAGQILEQARAAYPDDNAAGAQLAAFTHRGAARVWEAVSRDTSLDPEARVARLEEAAGAETRALQFDPNLVDAVVTKESIVRALADEEQDANRRAALLTQADDLRARATRLRQGLGLGGLARRSAPGEGAPDAGSEWRRPASRRYRGAGEAPVVAQETAPTAPPETGTARGEEVPPPRRVKYVPPVYPQDAIEMGIEGTVVIEVRIDEQGSIVDAKVVESIRLLDAAALDAVRQWQYAPTIRDGKAIPLTATVSVAFSLK